jgi:hypothetical protein
MGDVTWAISITAFALAGGYLLAGPGLIRMHKRQAIGIASWASLAFAVALWWAAFLSGLGQTSPYNTVELFVLAGLLVIYVYLGTALPFVRRAGPAIAVASVVAVVLLRALAPHIAE